MKYAKMLGLLAVAAAAMMAFAATASATQLKSPAGTVYTGVIKATSSHTVLHGVTDITCAHSEVEGTVTSHGADPITTKGHISKLTFTSCNHPVTVIKPGSLELHTEISGTKNGNGTLTSSGAEVTVVASTIFGKVHCIYGTSNTDIGRVTGSVNTKGHAFLHIDSAPINDVETNPLCGSTSEWTGSYTVTSPTYLDVT